MHTETTIIVTTKIKGIKVKVPKNIEGEVELNQNTICMLVISSYSSNKYEMQGLPPRCT